MALNLKQVITVGLGLGLTTAFGYHFLSSPKPTYTPARSIQVNPLGDYDMAATPEPIRPSVDPTTARQLPNQLPGQVSNQMDPSAGYEKLAAAQTRSVNPLTDSNRVVTSSEPFALELNSPETASANPQAIGSPESNDEMEWDLTDNFDFAFAPEDSDQNQNVPEVAAFQATEQTQVTTSPAATPTPASLVNSSQGNQTTSNWKGNPFATSSSTAPAMVQKRVINNQYFQPNANLHQTTEVATAKPNEPDFVANTDFAPQNNDRVMSLNDPGRVQLPQEPQSVIQRPMNHAVDSNFAYDLASIQPQQVPLNEATAQQAAKRIEYGKALSRRGAGFSARQEFLAALQMIANDNDNTTNSNLHSRSLKQALLTIEEAADFSVATPEQQIHMDVAAVVETHRCKVLTPAEAGQLSPVQAMNRYFSAAQKQLDVAGGRNVVTSEAFFCLGKLNTMLTRNQKIPSPYDTAQSVVFHQAALLSDHEHHRSANELGVLLAKNGRLSQAKTLFERSLRSTPTARTWQNLAETHRRLGEMNLANQANNEFRMLASRQVPNSNSEIQWMPVEQFNAEAPVDVNQQRVATRPAALTPAKKTSFKDRLKELF